MTRTGRSTGETSRGTGRVPGRVPGQGAHASRRPAREERWIPTTCTMCYNSCAIQVLVRDGVATAIEGLPGAPPNYGKTNAKTKSMLAELYNPHRVIKPLRRTNPEKGLEVDPKWEEIAWEEALNIIAERLKDLRERNPRGLIINSFDWPADVETVGAFASAFGGAVMAGAVPASAWFFCGNSVHPISYTLLGSQDYQVDVTHCQYMLVFGAQRGTGVGAHSMQMARDLADARVEKGLKMVVVDPCRTNTGARADEWIPIVPGTDAAFCLAMLNVLVNESGIYDEEFLRSYTNAPYLIRPNGHYARHATTGKPLVLSKSRGGPVQYEAIEPQDIALEGECQIGAEKARTAFAVLREHLRRYTPEYASQVTTVPAATVRRIAREFGAAARIGATTVIDGVTLPLRPACAIWNRGLSQHQHGLQSGWAAAMLNIIVGTVDVPGGICHSGAIGPWGMPEPDPDGLLVPVNPYHIMQMRRSLPLKPAQFDPNDPNLEGMFPIATYSRTMGTLSLKEPDKRKIDYKAEVLICSRTNPMKSAGDPEETAEMLKGIPFQVSFVQHHEETSQFADIVLPDTHFLERLVGFAYNGYTGFPHSPKPSDKEWTFAIQQPVVKPMGEARHWVEVLWELAHRLGIADDFYSALNVAAGLDPEHRLERDQHYSYGEFCDKWARAWCGEEHGLDYFKEHGWAASPMKHQVQHGYPRIFCKNRIPLYLEHWLTAGESIREVVEEVDIEWGDLSDYEPLVNYRPCWASQEGGEDFPLHLVSPKVSFLGLNTSTIRNPHLQDMSWAMGEIFNAGIHPSVAEGLGISTGDTIEIESANGKTATITARVTPDVHPGVVSVPGNAAKVLSPDGKEVVGEGVHLNKFLPYRLERLDMVSSALDACVKIRIRKIKGGKGGGGLTRPLKGIVGMLAR
ncbi:MAG: molybdopterin-dependent oxidoreductase [Dehalococcoidia bacterium]